MGTDRKDWDDAYLSGDKESWEAYLADMEEEAANDPGPSEETLMDMEREYLASHPKEDEAAFWDASFQENKEATTLTEYVKQRQQEGRSWSRDDQEHASEMVNAQMDFIRDDRNMAVTEAHLDAMYRRYENMEDGREPAAYQAAALHDTGDPAERQQEAVQTYRDELNAVFGDVYDANRILQSDETGLRGRMRANGSYTAVTLLNEQTRGRLSAAGYDGYEANRFQEDLDAMRARNTAGLVFDVKRDVMPVPEREVQVRREPERAPEEKPASGPDPKDADWYFEEKDMDFGG